MWLRQANISRFRSQLSEMRDEFERRALLDLLKCEEKLLWQARSNDAIKASESE